MLDERCDECVCSPCYCEKSEEDKKIDWALEISRQFDYFRWADKIALTPEKDYPFGEINLGDIQEALCVLAEVIIQAQEEAEAEMEEEKKRQELWAKKPKQSQWFCGE